MSAGWRGRAGAMMPSRARSAGEMLTATQHKLNCRENYLCNNRLLSRIFDSGHIHLGLDTAQPGSLEGRPGRLPVFTHHVQCARVRQGRRGSLFSSSSLYRARPQQQRDT